MNKTLVFEIAFLKLLLNGTPLANVWDNAASSPLANIYISLLTGDPGRSGTQTTNETTYTGYARVAVVRSTLGWTVDATTGIASPVATITFGIPTVGSGTITHAGLGRDLAGTGYLFAVGTVTSNLVITIGVAPQLTTSSQWAEV